MMAAPAPPSSVSCPVPPTRVSLPFPPCSVSAPSGQQSKQNRARRHGNHDHVDQVSCGHQQDWRNIGEFWASLCFAALWLVCFLCTHQIPNACGSGAHGGLTLTLSLSKFAFDLKSPCHGHGRESLRALVNQTSPARMVDDFKFGPRIGRSRRASARTVGHPADKLVASNSRSRQRVWPHLYRYTGLLGDPHCQNSSGNRALPVRLLSNGACSAQIRVVLWQVFSSSTRATWIAVDCQVQLGRA